MTEDRIDNNRAEQNSAPPRLGIVRWIFSVGVRIAAFVLQMLASVHPELIERYYSRDIYPYIGHGLAYANHLCGFSLAELIVYLLLFSLLGWVAFQARQLYLNRLSWRRFFFTKKLNLTKSAGVGKILFMLLWGLNYERLPLAENMRMERREANADELESVCRAIVAETNRSYEEMHGGADYRVDTAAFDDTLINTLPTNRKVSWQQLDKFIESAYQHESLLGNAALGGYGPPKPVYSSQLMSQFGISGIYIPFTGEPNINAQLPDCELPFTIAHEKAHQRGYALEDEANFIAFLVCIKSADPFCRYSGYLMAASHLLSSFYRLAPQRYAEGRANQIGRAHV